MVKEEVDSLVVLADCSRLGLAHLLQVVEKVGGCLVFYFNRKQGGLKMK